MKNVITTVNKPGSIEVTHTPERQSAFYGRNAIVSVLLCIVIAALIRIVFDTTIIPGNVNLRSVIIPICCYILLGVFFVALYRRLQFLSKSGSASGITYAFIVFAGVVTALLVIGFMKGHGSLITSLFYSCLFFLPYTIYQAGLFYNYLSLISYNKIWYLPERTTHTGKATVFLNSIHIKIKMAPVYGAPEQMYETTIPGRLSVGDMFDNFINNDDDTDGGNAVFEDLNSQHFGWQFFAPSFLGLGTRLIDADLSLHENNIKHNDVVIARRIPKQLALHMPQIKIDLN